MRDHNPNSNEAADSSRHMLGLNGFDVNLLDIVYKNVIMEAYTISIVPSNSNTGVRIEDCLFNNAWQNHIFLWSNNWLQTWGGEEYNCTSIDQIWPVHQRLQLVIKNSKLTKSGGPVILQSAEMPDSDGRNFFYNLKSGTDIYVDKASEISTYVTGTEAWFEAYSMYAADIIRLLKPMDTMIQNASKPNDNAAATATIMTTQEGTGATQFMNMVCAATGGVLTYTLVDDVDNITAETSKALLNSESALVQALRQISTQGLGLAPVLQSTENPDSFAIFPCTDPDAAPPVMDVPLDVSSGNLLGYPSPTTATSNPDFFKGDYLGFYQNGAGGTPYAVSHYQVSLLLGYYH